MQNNRFNIHNIPEYSGVYQFKNNASQILYIGKAKNLKRRVSSYFQKTSLDHKTAQFVPDISSIDIIPVQSEFEALMLEAELIRSKRPKYNVIWKDDKHYIYVVITKEEFPKVRLARRNDQIKGDFFGPFPSKQTLSGLLRYIRGIFPFCTQKKESRRSCFYTHLGLCHPCPSNIRYLPPAEFDSAKKKYRKNISAVRFLLNGKIDRVTAIMRKEMNAMSQVKDFEGAAIIRDRLRNLQFLTSVYAPPNAYIENPDLAETTWRSEEAELATFLKSYFPGISLNKIECFDISNISGKYAVGSMVTFIRGVPEKKYYRRFKVRLKNSPDDSAMIGEIFKRRLGHPEWPYPDLFVVDGGKPQLLAIQQIISILNIKKPVIGLAKRFEEIVIPVKFSRVNLRFEKIAPPKDSPALHLLQRLRDEAHRFAHRYHDNLRLKSLLSVYQK